MLRRKIYDKLLAWKNSTGKKDAILLRGVRQCGKTYILSESLVSGNIKIL